MAHSEKHVVRNKSLFVRNLHEKPYLDYLKKELGHDRVWAVGPLLPVKDSFAAGRGGSSSLSVDDVVSWLDQRREREVVYVCFGSQTFLTDEQTAGIASGLVKSGIHFVWSIKERVNVNNRDDGDDDGCDDWAAGLDASRGLVIRGWAPQVVILRHKAVGAFLTHCGWNSVVESVVAGVPVLAWPMSADQFVDATLLVEELKVAEKVCEGEKTVPDSDLLSRVLAESVGGTGEETRKKMLELQAKAVDAIGEGGSSDKDLGCLMEHLQISLKYDVS